MFLVAAAAFADEVRLDPAEPETPAEADAVGRFADRRCGWAWGLVIPGVSRLCYRRPVEGAVLLGLSAAEAGAFYALAANEHPNAVLPLFGIQNTYLAGIGLTAIDRALAHHRPYTPTESLGELVVAPFDPHALKDRGVWIGGSLVTAGAIALTVLESTPDRGATPNVFGLDLPLGAAIPVFAAADALTFSHVAIGEEVIFRGVAQSAFSRWTTPTTGWALGSLLFGAIHLQNLLAIPADQRKSYVLYGLPYITLTGAVIGATYQRSGYRLAPAVAIHFWYDALISATAFALDPDDHTFSARIGGAF